MAQELIAGVYRVHDAHNKVSYIGYTFNLRGILKRFRFELGLNACTVKPLQAMYNNAGGKVDYEVLEEVTDLPEDNDSERDKRLCECMNKWQKALEKEGEVVKVILL